MMSPDDQEASDRQDMPPPSDDEPEVEDAYAPEESGDEPAFEEEPDLLDSASRLFEGEPAESDDSRELPAPASVRMAHDAQEKEDAGDTDSITDEPETAADLATATPPQWDKEVSARRVVIELKRVETEIRELLENRDSKRKRKLTGTRRWLELEEDIVSWRFTGRFDEETLARLRQLVTRRHYLFTRLRFLAGTRSTWNT